MLEDEVIDILASDSRQRGLAVLAEGGNQMRAFRFQVPGRRRKAPDLVIYGFNHLICFEAKVRGVDLLRHGAGGLSDTDVQVVASSSPDIKFAMAEEALRRLEAAGRPAAEIVDVSFGLISGTLSEEVGSRARTAGLCYVVTDVHSGTWQSVVETPALAALFPNS